MCRVSSLPDDKQILGRFGSSVDSHLNTIIRLSIPSLLSIIGRRTLLASLEWAVGQLYVMLPGMTCHIAVH